MAKQNREKPLCLSQLIQFYNETLEPRFGRIDQEFVGIRGELRDINGHTEFIYKKLEDLNQEYLVANEQMKRLAKSDEFLLQEVSDLKKKFH